MIEKCHEGDFNEILGIINDAASAYKGIIPADRYRDPYMAEEELRIQIDEGVEFWCYKVEGYISGIMGMQDKVDVTLIRHAYTRTSERNKGIGSKLLVYLYSISRKPVLIGTWADATWAIKFYEKHGFRLLSDSEKEILLRRYWNIPDRQVNTSVVLASETWENKNSR